MPHPVIIPKNFSAATMVLPSPRMFLVITGILTRLTFVVLGSTRGEEEVVAKGVKCKPQDHITTPCHRYSWIIMLKEYLSLITYHRTIYNI